MIGKIVINKFVVCILKMTGVTLNGELGAKDAWHG